MNTKRVVGITLTVVVLLLLATGARSAQTRDVSAEAPRVPPTLPVPQPPVVAQALPAAIPVQAPPTETFSGAIVTQVFSLQAGWNAIYLGVEPINESPAGNDGVPTRSVMEWVFKDLAASGALESVWTYNRPVSQKDYIIDPSEGLWDVPGWERYVPAEMLGADGQSQGFLSNLYMLHANTSYLVKLKAGTSGTIQVRGKPVVSHPRWALDAHNLAGFPLPLTGGITVRALKAASPITDIHGLTSEGAWTSLADDVALNCGQGYLVYYSDPGSTGRTDFTAPLDVQAGIGGSLAFRAGYGGRRQTLRLENLTDAPVTVNLLLAGGALDISRVTGTPPNETLTPLTDPVTVGAGWAENVVLQIDAAGLTGPTEGILQISAATPGVRWLVPIAAEPGSIDGLWVGEVVVNNVSEARLGGTGPTDLAVSLAQQNASSVRGSAQFHEDVVTTSVEVTVTLSLPLPDPAPVQVTEGTAPYVGGYVFLDENRNGQRDASERGLSGVTVTLEGSETQTTGDDGSYVFSGVSAGSHAISANLGTGYTSSFDVSLPDGDGTPVANVLPTGVTVAVGDISDVAPTAYLAQILPDPYTTLPYTDATGAVVQPMVNFGYAVAHTVHLSAGACTAPGSEIASGTALNGQLTFTLDDTTLAELTGKAHVRVERLGVTVACGNLAIGAPTQFDNGSGSEFRFRLLLRVDEDRVAELLPHYALTETVNGPAFPRLSSPALSIGCAATGSTAFAAGNEMKFSIDIPAQDPLNPFKHKYHPDHDNLDAKFEPFETDLSPYLWESFTVKRTIALELTNEPAFGEMTPAEAAALAAQLDWGGENWGGNYTEIIEGLHQNDITVKGYFVIRHAVAGENLIAQDFDTSCATQ